MPLWCTWKGCGQSFNFWFLLARFYPQVKIGLLLLKETSASFPSFSLQLRSIIYFIIRVLITTFKSCAMLLVIHRPTQTKTLIPGKVWNVNLCSKLQNCTLFFIVVVFSCKTLHYSNHTFLTFSLAQSPTTETDKSPPSWGWKKNYHKGGSKLVSPVACRLRWGLLSQKYKLWWIFTLFYIILFYFLVIRIVNLTYYMRYRRNKGKVCPHMLHHSEVDNWLPFNSEQYRAIQSNIWNILEREIRALGN